MLFPLSTISTQVQLRRQTTSCTSSLLDHVCELLLSSSSTFFLCPYSCLSLEIYCVILNLVWILAKDKNASLLCELPHTISGRQKRRSEFACWEWYVCMKTSHHFCIRSLSFPLCFSREVRLHDKSCNQGVDLINSFLEDVFPSTKINIERSMGAVC